MTRIFCVREKVCVLPSDLSCHKAVGDFIPLKIIPDREKIKTDILGDDMNRRAACKRRIHIHHIRVKAVAGVRRDPARFVKLIKAPVPLAEAAQVAVLKHNALGNAC